MSIKLIVCNMIRLFLRNCGHGFLYIIMIGIYGFRHVDVGDGFTFPFRIPRMSDSQNCP